MSGACLGWSISVGKPLRNFYIKKSKNFKNQSYKRRCITIHYPLFKQYLPHGLAWDGAYLWISDFRTHKLIKINPNYGFGLDSIIAPGNNGNIGFSWFNGHLFLGDINTDSIYQINPVTKEVVNQWLCPYTNPRDMEFDGQYLWFVAYEERKIYKMFLPITSVQHERLCLANNFILSQNYPNPFNPGTTIMFSFPSRSFVSICEGPNKSNSRKVLS